MKTATVRGVWIEPVFLLIGIVIFWKISTMTSTYKEPVGIDSKPALAQVPVNKVKVLIRAATLEFSGYLQAVKAVDIRPRVSGHIESIHFT